MLALPVQASSGVIAGVSALAIAFVAYPWQKEVDRQLAIDAELRGAYAKYLNAEAKLIVASQGATRSETRAESLKKFDEAFSELTASLKLIQLLAPRGISDVLGKHFMAVSELAFAAAHGLPHESKEEQARQLIEKYNKLIGDMNGALRPAFYVRPASWH